MQQYFHMSISKSFLTNRHIIGTLTWPWPQNAILSQAKSYAANLLGQRLQGWNPNHNSKINMLFPVCDCFLVV